LTKRFAGSDIPFDTQASAGLRGLDRLQDC